MASTLTQILLHITFSTKDRVPLIRVELEPDLCAYVGGICRRMESPLWTMGGTSDHVHMLVSMGKTVTLSELMLNIKRDSSKWMKEQVRTFKWPDGYFGFSIGASGVDALQTYIANQKRRHKTNEFKDEVRTLLRKYKMKWDERYIWD